MKPSSYSHHMERGPFLFLLADPDPQPESNTQPVSQVGTDCFDFEFPTAISRSSVPNDVVFCGKVITRQTQPRVKNRNPFLLLRSESSSSSARSNRAANPVRSASTGENRWWRGGSSGRKHRNGLFGSVKFPLQMELSDMKMRQERREQLQLPLPKLTAEGGGGAESSLELVQPVRRRSQLMNALAKATFGCIPIA